jgi:hypothetical protein
MLIFHPVEGRVCEDRAGSSSQDLGWPDGLQPPGGRLASCCCGQVGIIAKDHNGLADLLRAAGNEVDDLGDGRVRVTFRDPP